MRGHDVPGLQLQALAELRVSVCPVQRTQRGETYSDFLPLHLQWESHPQVWLLHSQLLEVHLQSQLMHVQSEELHVQLAWAQPQAILIMMERLAGNGEECQRSVK